MKFGQLPQDEEGRVDYQQFLAGFGHLVDSEQSPGEQERENQIRLKEQRDKQGRELDARKKEHKPILDSNLAALYIQCAARRLAAKGTLNTRKRLQKQRVAQLEQLRPMYDDLIMLPDLVPDAKRREILDRLIERDICGDGEKLTEATPTPT